MPGAGVTPRMDTIRIGQRFPRLEVNILDAGRLLLPDDLAGKPAILIFYRGHW